MNHSMQKLFGLGALALALSACGPEYDRTEVSGVTPSKLGGGVSTRSIEVHQGMIVKAHIVVWNDDNEQMSLSVRAADSRIVEVAGVINERDYAFVGLAVGTTEVQFVADEDLVLTVPVTVLPQP